jgi:acyl carrier protein
MTENQTAIINVFKDFDPHVNLDTKIDDLKLDSLDVLDVLMQIQKKFSVDVPLTQLLFIEDVQSVLEYIENAKSRGT